MKAGLLLMGVWSFFSCFARGCFKNCLLLPPFLCNGRLDCFLSGHSVSTCPNLVKTRAMLRARVNSDPPTPAFL